MKELINIHILELLFNLHTDESKILTLVITNGRRDMLTRKVFSEKFIFYLNEKNMIKIFLTEYKFIFTERKYTFWYHEKKVV